LLHAYKEARVAYRNAEDVNDPDAMKAAKDELDALSLFRSDMGTYVRFYTFLCQIFDYGNTALEKQAMFFKRLLPLLEFEREMPTVDLSKVVLTHHHLRNKGQKILDLGQGDPEKLSGLSPGGGAVQDKEKALLAEIISKLNDLFTGDLSESDKVTYVRSVIRGKLLESPTLQQQASANSKEQFGSSPDLGNALMDAIISALDAHQAMSSQALTSAGIRDGMKEILLNKTGLYEELRERAAAA